ncbi:MAG: gamma-glutamyltransferase [Dehalococcoidia bacterium]|nr:gamma-glutamyltransferase [Dehalococcoidia bacterium]MDW8120016.1 gamma-glutamyltransferase [Chloroflexota bacterium]
MALSLTVTTGRSVVLTRNGMVCSASPLAGAVGLRVLQEGGNAIDATIATAAAEGVVLPPMCGLGGEVFALVYWAREGKVYGVTGSGKAPLKATREFFVSRGYTVMPQDGPLAVAIPGEVDAFDTLLRRFGSGKFSLARLLEPAIALAEEGFPLPPRITRYLVVFAPQLARHPSTARIFLNNGRPYQPGDILRQPELARSLRAIADKGPREFYEGELARRLVQGLQEEGGLYTLQEWAAHRTIVYDTPLTTTYRGFTVYETHLPSQGILVLQMLNILEGLDLRGMGHTSADYIHLLTEAKKLAYADRLAYLGDPEFVPAPWQALLDKGYAAERRKAIDMRRAAPSVAPGALAVPAGDGATSYFCVIDRQGNAVSFIHSLSNAFGACRVVGDTGILLNNRVGRGFSLVEGHPNVIAPGKRTMHTLNAYMVFQGGRLHLIGGTPGGDNQPQWNVQVLTRLLDFGLNPQEAAEAPRFTHFPGTDPVAVDAPPELRLEEPFLQNTALVDDLKRRGHAVGPYPASGFLGGVQIIAIDPATGVRMGGSDPRCDGGAYAH